MSASTLLVEPTTVQKYQNEYLVNFELLNVHLLKYIPDQLEDKEWCTLPELLEEYGLSFPKNISDFIQNKISFPLREGQIPEGHLGFPIHPSTTGQFQPGQNISLRLHQTTLGELSKVLEDLEVFQKPLIDHLQMLVFFKIKHSILFEKYLQFHLKKVMKTRQVHTHMPVNIYMSLPPPMATPTKQIPDDFTEGLPINEFVQALEKTKSLVFKIMKGEATYSEILANGELLLEELNVEKEFTLFYEFKDIAKVSSADNEGLYGVQNILELFQFTSSHIENIYQACKHYDFRHCLEDQSLKELIVIMQSFKSEEDKSKVTPRVASKNIKQIKKILCLDKAVSSKCLDIFPAMMESKAFYQFMLEKKFFGKQGPAIFQQQYELITAQLQHEEYEESVLNHLLAAFKVISIFLDTEQNLADLMKKVTALNVEDSLKQLETVNTNINLIRKWFSRVQVRSKPFPHFPLYFSCKIHLFLSHPSSLPIIVLKAMT